MSISETQNGNSEARLAIRSDAAFSSADSVATPLQAGLRYKWSILAFAAVVTVLAAAFVQTLPIRYVASASVMVDPRELRVTGDQSLLSTPQIDVGFLLTVMEPLHSPKLAARVVQTLHLTQIPEFENCPNASRLALPALSNVMAMFHRDQTSRRVCVSTVDTAVRHLLSVVTFSNDQTSYIIRIRAEAPDAVLAANIANTYAHAYVQWQEDARSKLAQQADTWLTADLAYLRKQMQAADNAAERYREQHNLLTLGGNNGSTLVSQTLSEFNSQLSVASIELATKMALLQELQSQEKKGRSLGDLAAVLNSPDMAELASKLADRKAKVADLSTRFGSSHPSVKAAEAEVAQNRQQLAIASKRVIDGLKDQVMALQLRQSLLKAQEAKLIGQLSGQSKQQVQLGQLERDARATRGLYQAMMIRLKQVGAEERMQRSDVEIAVEATPPAIPDYPRKKMMVVGAFLASLGVGVTLAFLRTAMSSAFANIGQFERVTGLRILGVFPKRSRRLKSRDPLADIADAAEAESLNAVLASLFGSLAEPAPGQGKVLLVTSVVPREGKTSLALALGHAAMRCGYSVLLFDGDLRESSLSNLLVRQTDVVAHHEMEGSKSRLRVLSLSNWVQNPHQISGRTLKEVFERARTAADLTIIDTPPLTAVSDAVKLAVFSDGIVLLIDVQRTARAAITYAISTLQLHQATVHGVVLGKLDLRKSLGWAPHAADYYRGVRWPRNLTRSV